MKILEPAGKFMLVALVPFLILMTAIRILLNPIFPQMEYYTPNFPPDPYGFSLQDRLKYSTISLEFLVNSDSLDTLAAVRLPDNQTPLYNERELSHMEDVKVLVQHMLTVHTILVIVLGLVLVLAWQQKKLKEFFRLLSKGGWVTIGLIVLVLVGVAASFTWLFTKFHELFFSGDTWLFQYSDSLIRLFPMQFWQDAFIAFGAISILLALILGVFGRLLARKSA
jgi:integral membrane protein (TIGR01906 family)